MSVLAEAVTDELPGGGRDARVAVGGAKLLFIRLAPQNPSTPPIHAWC